MGVIMQMLKVNNTCTVNYNTSTGGLYWVDNWVRACEEHSTEEVVARTIIAKSMASATDVLCRCFMMVPDYLLY
jgi:hypothetical protein